MMATLQSIDEVQQEIVEEFELLGDWTERYKYIADLGRGLPPFPENLRLEENKVKGCQSQVWLSGRLENGRVGFDADSDALIVRGLVALALRVYSERTPEEILANPPEFVNRIGMSEHLSANRANGLQAVIKQIKRYALAFGARTENP